MCPSFTADVRFGVTSPELLDAALEEEEGGTLIARKVGEAVQSTLGAVVGAIDIPLGESLPGEALKEAGSKGYQCLIQLHVTHSQLIVLVVA